MTNQEAIGYLLDTIGKREQHDEAIALAISALQAQEALQLTCNNLATDTIYRQAALKICRKYWHPTFNPIMEEIEQLLSVQPELYGSDEAAKHLNDLIFDINPWEICSQIESDNLSDWCKTIQTEMKMAMVQLPCWAERRTDE